MSYQAVEAVMKGSRATGSERLLLMVIATHADAETMTAYLGETTLCKEANMKERNLRYTLAKLKTSGELQCVVGGGRGRANLYRISLAQSDKGAEDCPVSNEQLNREKGQGIAPLSDQKGQPTAGFVEAKGGNPSSEKGQPVAEKGQPAAPQPYEPERTEEAIHTSRPRGAPEFEPEREAEIVALHAYYCRTVEVAPLTIPAWKTLNRALGEKGADYCREVVDGCALDDWEDRQFNNSITFIFETPKRMDRLAKIAAVKKARSCNGKSDGGTQNGAGGHTPQARNGRPSREERRLAELSRQDPLTILGAPHASNLDRKPDRKAASPSGGDYDAGRTAVHFR